MMVQVQGTYWGRCLGWGGKARKCVISDRSCGGDRGEQQAEGQGTLRFVLTPAREQATRHLSQAVTGQG